MIALSAVGFKQGDPYRLLTPYDSVGNKCGAMNQGNEADIYGDVNVTDFTEYKYKLFTAPTSAKPFTSVCVKYCPKELVSVECMKNSENTECLKVMPFDTTHFSSYCIPTGSEVKAMVEQLYK